MATLKCSDCGHTWDTRDRLEETQDPKCGECHSRDFEVVERDSNHGDDTLREALRPLDVDTEYVTQFFDPTDDDAERLRDLLVEAGADSKRATRAAEWYFRQTDRDLNVPQKRESARQQPDTTDADEIAKRTAREIEQHIKPDDGGDQENERNPREEVRDMAQEQFYQKANQFMDELNPVLAFAQAAQEEIRQDPELYRAFRQALPRDKFISLIERVGENYQDSGNSDNGGPPAAARAGIMGGGPSETGIEDDNHQQPSHPDERARQARIKAEQSDGEAPPPVTADDDDETERETDESDGDDTEEVVEDFTEVA